MLSRLLLISFALLFANTLACADTPKATLTFEGPAYVDMPVWVHVTLPDTPEFKRVQANLRYPFDEIPWFFNGHKFRVLREGKPLQGLVQQIGSGDPYRPSLAPPGSPVGRLPLHLLYRFDRPGKYLVKYEYEAEPEGKGPPPAIRTESDWIELEVKPFSRQQREQWLTQQLAHPPREAGLLAGDYLPSLLAYPDARVLEALTECFYRPDHFVQSMAVYSLDRYPGATVAGMLPEVVRRKGPFWALSFLIIWRPEWFRASASDLIEAALPYLDSNQPERVAYALNAILVTQSHQINFHGPAREKADAAIWDHVDRFLATRDPVVYAPILSFVSVRPSARSREVIWEIANRPEASKVRPQALQDAAVLGAPEDLPRLGALLTTSDPAVLGLPSQLRITWKEQATPYLVAGLQSPNSETRLACAYELAQIGQKEGLSYLLGLMEGTDDHAKGHIMGFMIDHLGLPNGALQSEAVELLKKKLESK